jgi:hypothetical protein
MIARIRNGVPRNNSRTAKSALCVATQCRTPHLLRQPMGLPSLLHLLHDSAYLLHPIHLPNPRSVLSKRINFFNLPLFSQYALPNLCPRAKRQIRKRALVANQPACIITLQALIEHANHAHDFSDVARSCRGQGLRVKARKPGCLAGIRALAYCLE